MVRQLTTRRRGLGFGEVAQCDLIYRDTQSEHQRAVAIMWEQIVAWRDRVGKNGCTFMSGARHLKPALTLPYEHALTAVAFARLLHEAQNGQGIGNHWFNHADSKEDWRVPASGRL